MENTFEVFLSNVIIGKSKDFGDKQDDSLTEPPNQDDGIPFDSVKGKIDDCEVYITYEN